MHRRELTALSTAARTRVHISLRLAARRASDTKDSKPHGSSSRARRSCERYDTCVVGFAAFASTAGGIHTTHAERRATRQSSSARTANATTPQVYPLLRRSSSARSPPRPAWPSSSVARVRVRGREAGRARRGGFEERRLEVKGSGRRKMNLILTCSRRWRRWRPMSPRRRRHDQAGVYAPREGAAAVSRRRRLRGAGRRLQARARRTMASTSTKKPPASSSSTHGYVLTTSARCRTRASLVVLERHAPASY